jgi:hypothetical protein
MQDRRVMLGELPSSMGARYELGRLSRALIDVETKEWGGRDDRSSPMEQSVEVASGPPQLVLTRNGLAMRLSRGTAPAHQHGTMCLPAEAGSGEWPLDPPLPASLLAVRNQCAAAGWAFASSTCARLSRVRIRISVAANPSAAITEPPRNAAWKPSVSACGTLVPPAAST